MESSVSVVTSRRAAQGLVLSTPLILLYGFVDGTVVYLTPSPTLYAMKHSLVDFGLYINEPK